MIIARTVAAVFGTNCYVLAPYPGATALVVDPGVGARRGALALLRANGLKLGAVLLTHGHADHVWDVGRLLAAAAKEDLLADAAQAVPVYIPEPDRYRLDDPDATTAIRTNGMNFTQIAGSDWKCPENICVFPEAGYSQSFEIVPQVALRALPAPGHTEGSTLFFCNARLEDNDLLFEAEALNDPAAVTKKEYLLALTGDVIFKGSVGRTDLPGGDQVQMWATLRLLASVVNPETVLFPGHGAVTTMAHENHANPYLAEAKVRGGERQV